MRRTNIALLLACLFVLCGCDEVMPTIEVGADLLGTNPQKCNNVIAGEYELEKIEERPSTPLNDVVR